MTGIILIIKQAYLHLFFFLSYECDCEWTGFVGNHCEDDILECASDPCKHGATCLEGINQYKCLCWPGTLWLNTGPDTNQLNQKQSHINPNPPS